MRTTVDINDAQLREVRQLAKASGHPFKRVLNDGLMLGLAMLNKPSKRARVRIKAHPLGIKPGFSGVSMNQLYDQLEAEEQVRR